MSKKKRTRLNDQPIEGFADLEDELPAAGPAGPAGPAGHRAAELAPAPRAHAEPAPAPAYEAPSRPASVRRTPAPKSARSLPWGAVYTASVITAGVGLGAVTLLASGGAAAGAWKPADLFAVRNYLAPASHPLNLLAMLSLAVGVVGAAGGRRLGAYLRRLEGERATAEKVVDKLTALRLDNEGPWADAALREHPAAGTFVAEILGAWRLQGARLRRVNGAEGEIVRLQKALAENTREVLTGRFDSQAVGALADEMVRFLDARNADAQELSELRRRNREDSEAIVTLIQDARAWNRATLEQIGTQGAALERMARRLEDLGSALGGSGPAPGGQAASLLADIRHDLDGQGGARAPRAATGLDDLAAQGSKLAFQIAMEVARLGPRGERLQPMSQSLEELTTSLRQALDAGDGASGAPADLGAVLGKIDALSRQLGRPGADALSPEAMEEIGRAGPVVGRVAANLADVARRFQAQSERLVELGTSFSALTGVPFDASALPAGQPEPAAESGLRVIPQDPFCRDNAARTQVDPFAGNAPPAAAPAGPPPAPEPAPAAAPTPVAAQPTPAAAPSPAAEADDDGFVIERTSLGGPVLDRSQDADFAPLELDSILPERREAPEAPVARPAAQDEDRIHDLSEFGAVRLDQDEDVDDVVHDLSEFGAVRVA